VPIESIYLDNNSTTPIDPRVVEAMTRVWRNKVGNPASQHSFGRKTRHLLEDAREGILELIGAKTGGMDADQLIFTSGGTEANNLALFGLCASPIAGTRPGLGAPQARPPRAIASPLEHPSVSAALVHLADNGWKIDYLVLNDRGLAQWDSLAAEPHRIATLMLANNETGAIQHVAELATICRERHTLFHTDAVQAVGKIPVHFRNLGVDALSLAPHKFHGPLGIGGLVLRHGVNLQPRLFGGFQQAGLRPGTENVALAVGFHAALELAIDELPERAARMKALRDDLEKNLLTHCADFVILGRAESRLPNTSCISFPGLDRQALAMAFDLAGVACSTGSACASGSSEPSPTLLAMGLPKAVIDGAIRLSLSAFTTADDVAEATRRILKTVNHLRSRK
jgi:cysteine desulfurase